jgi:multidrug transporter EmrE-like cation transporter
MAAHNLHTPGGGSAIGLKLEEAIVSGVAMGVSGLFVHMGMLDAGIDAAFLLRFVQNPWSWLSVALGAFGFVYLQKALHREKISYVVPTVSACSIITPVILSVVILQEYVSPVQWAGIWFIMLGVIGISKGEWDEELLSGTINRLDKKR